MKEFLRNIVSFIVSDPTQIEITETSNNGFDTYTILVPSVEVGKVIGKEGRVINALRCLARFKASRENKRVLVKVEAHKENGSSTCPASVETGSSEETSR